MTMDDLKPFYQWLALINNKWSKAGSCEVRSWRQYVEEENAGPTKASIEEFRESRGIPAKLHLNDGHLVFTYDFMDDELTPTETDEFIKDFFDSRPQFDHPVRYDFDGSGNGLYYGMEILQNEFDVQAVGKELVVRGTDCWDANDIIQSVRELAEPKLREWLKSLQLTKPVTDEDVNALIEEWGFGSLVLFEFGIKFKIEWSEDDYTLTIA